MSVSKEQHDIDTLLHAAGGGKFDLVRRLVSEGISVNASNHSGGTALMAASASYRTAIIDLLLGCGADIAQRTSDQRTALHAAVNSTPSLPDQQEACVRILLQHGAAVDVQDGSGLTPLMCASWFGCTLAVRALLQHGADRSLSDVHGRKAEDLARLKGRSEIVELLQITP